MCALPWLCSRETPLLDCLPGGYSPVGELRPVEFRGLILSKLLSALYLYIPPSPESQVPYSPGCSEAEVKYPASPSDCGIPAFCPFPSKPR